MLKSDFPSQVPLLTSEIIPEVSMNKKLFIEIRVSPAV